MIRNILSFASLFFLFFCGCKTYTANDFPDTYLQFGNGGGFTGMTTEYTLLKNGQLFMRNGRAGSGKWQELNQVNKSAAKDLFQTWEDNELLKEHIQQPGNRYYFISMQKDSLEFRQSWGASDYTPDASLKTFFQQAMELVKTITPEKEEP